MDRNLILGDIIDKIKNLNTQNYPLLLSSEKNENTEDNDLIDRKLRQIKRNYRLYQVLSVLCAGLLFVTGFLQVFEVSLIDLRKAGLLIVMSIAVLLTMCRLKSEIERINTIKYLIGLKDKLVNTSPD